MTCLAAKSHFTGKNRVIFGLLLVKADVFQDQDLHHERR